MASDSEAKRHALAVVPFPLTPELRVSLKGDVIAYRNEGKKEAEDPIYLKRI
ncbi:MAG: hypothetical protein N3D85_02370 [Candidatus Bathyarchaeota archaeon]|nr:hypothetical protein [Candidatus Bathyarchaeota archaeon]